MRPMPTNMGRFEFATLASLRTAQLVRGCTPRVTPCGKLTTTARLEVAEGRVAGIPGTEPPARGTAVPR